MVFIHFGLRMEIEELYLKWCEEEGVANKPNSFVVFMMSREWLNEEKIIEDLDHKTENCSEKPNNCKDDLHDVGRQIQSAYDKGAASDTSAIQALYTAVKPCKGEPQIFTWGKEVHEFCKMKCNKSKARSFDGDRFIVCGQSNDAICINLPACPLGKWITGKGYHILPMDES